MTYKRSSVNNNNLEAAKRKEKETSGRDKWYVVYWLIYFWQGFIFIFWQIFHLHIENVVTLIYLDMLKFYRPKTAGIGSSPPATRPGLSGRKWMDGWMLKFSLLLLLKVISSVDIG